MPLFADLCGPIDLFLSLKCDLLMQGDFPLLHVQEDLKTMLSLELDVLFSPVHNLDSNGVEAFPKKINTFSRFS